MNSAAINLSRDKRFCSHILSGQVSTTDMRHKPDHNPAAVSLGKLGGSKNTEPQQKARRKNALLGGRPTNAARFCAKLSAAIEFHRTNQNDPHGIGNAVMVALTEVRTAFATAFKVE